MSFSTPKWAVAPFVCYLLMIAVLPLFFGTFWERNRNKLLVAGLVSLPVLIYLATTGAGGGRALLHTACDYVSFIALLGALFANLSGGFVLSGSLVGTPLVNTAFLAVGAVLGSLVGTTGAFRALDPSAAAGQCPTSLCDRHRRVLHLHRLERRGSVDAAGRSPVVSRISAACRPFTWTLRLAAPWALVNGVLVSLFAIIDRVLWAREQRRPRPVVAAAEPLEPLRIEGGINLFWLLGIVGVVFAMGTYGTRLLGDSYLRSAIQVVGMLGCTALSLVSTAREVHETNRFSWAPIIEVAAVFAGVFVTMIPALLFLGERGASLGITKPWQFFWASGALSSVLDNAPTYLTFASLAVGVTNGPHGVLSIDNLGALAAHPSGQHLLAAVSCGAVLMGAITYIGNGPNFMVKAIAEQHHVRMPGFFGYTLWSFAILVPLFCVVSRLFF